MTHLRYTLEVLRTIKVNCERCQSRTRLSSLTLAPTRTLQAGARTLETGRHAWRYECGPCSFGRTDGYTVRLVDFLDGAERLVDWSTHLSSTLHAGELLNCFHRLRKEVLSIIELMDDPAPPDRAAQRHLEARAPLDRVRQVLWGREAEEPGFAQILLRDEVARSSPRARTALPPRWAYGKTAYAGAGLALAVVLAFVVAAAATRPLLDNIHSVTPGAVYRSAQLDPEHLEAVIARYHIRSILNLRGARPGSRWYDDEVAAAVRNGVVHADLELSAARDVPVSESERLVKLMDGLPKPLLIHSHVGADRSGLAAALYRYATGEDSAFSAATQLSAWYGHLPFLRSETAAMDRSFLTYVQSHRAGDGT